MKNCRIKKIFFSFVILMITGIGVAVISVKPSPAQAAECSADISLDVPREIVKATGTQITACWKNGFTVVATVQLLITSVDSGDTISTLGFWENIQPGAGTQREIVSWDTSSSNLGDYVITLKAFDQATHVLIPGASTSKSVSVVAETTTGGTGDGGSTGGDGGTSGGSGGGTTGGGGATGGGTTGGGTTGGGTAKSDEIDLTLPGDYLINTPARLYNSIIDFFRYAVMVAALIGVMYGGITILEAGADQQKMAGAKKMIKVSILGLVLAIFTNVIVGAAITTVLTIHNLT